MKLNKKLSVLAVGAAMAVASSSASADLTPYVKAHFSLDNFTDLETAAGESMLLSSNSSRFGLKGSTDAGGGLKAVFMWENTIDLDTGGAPGGDRNQYLGLSGNFGTVIFGMYDNPVKTVGRKADLWGDTTADSRAIIQEAGGHTGSRLGNVIGYMSPQLGPVSFAAGYVVKETDLSGLALMGTGKFGPVNVMLGYHTVESDLPANPDAETAVRLAVLMNFGMVGVNVLYSDVSGTNYNSNNGRTTMGVGVSIKAGPGKVKIQQYIAGESDQGTSDGGTQFAAGYDMKMSDKVNVYALYTAAGNDTNGTYRVAQGGYGDKGSLAQVAGTDSSASLSVGMVAKF